MTGNWDNTGLPVIVVRRDVYPAGETELTLGFQSIFLCILDDFLFVSFDFLITLIS